MARRSTLVVHTSWAARAARLCSALLACSAIGCGGGKHEPAKAPETNPWADYKGTYAGSPEPSKPVDVKPKTDGAKAMSGSVATETKADEDAAPPVPTKKASGKKRPKAVAKKAPKG
jgi:hypothetical protein